MPSGKPIDWSQYDHIISQYLPGLTIEAWRAQYAPFISAKAIGVRARKLGVKPAKYKPSDDHKDSIAISLSKESPELITKIRKFRDQLSLHQLAEEIGIGYATLSRLIKKHKIELSTKGKARAVEGTRRAHLGKKPWNKDGTLSEETKTKISIATSGENNSQYGRGMTEEEKERWREAYFLSGIYKMRKWLETEAGETAKQKSLKTTTSLEFRTSQSLLISQKILNGELYSTCRGIATHLKTVKGGEFTTKSSYETRYALQLDADPNVVSFVYEPLRIPYEWEGCEHYYVPDFLVRFVDSEILVEVKPLKLVNLPKNVAKIEAGHGFRIDFVVVTEEDLTIPPVRK